MVGAEAEAISSDSDADDGPAVEIKGLTTRFGEEIVHQDLDLTIEPGEILGLVGASGAGKSVLLSALLGLLEPESGQIKVFGKDITHASELEKLSYASLWGVVFQEGALFSNFTVRENVEVAMRQCADLPQSVLSELADIKIRMAQLPREAGDQYPAELSGGERRRAALARAIAADPSLLLLDEPTSGLDPIVAAELDSLILSLREMLGVTILFITHDLDSLYQVCDRVAVLADKRIAASGTPDELEKSNHAFARSYFTNPRAAAAKKASERAKAQRGTDGLFRVLSYQNAL